MLIKDHILVEKLTHITKNISINVALSFILNDNKVELSFDYIPDKFKFKQESVLDYLRELTKQETLDLENLSARVVEDLYDMAVPKKIELTLRQEVNSISTSITTSKSQPKFKI
tara:strand:- start:438 stop:779 length:342 start_codon:yes stop_codon:yes gene_type:complete